MLVMGGAPSVSLVDERISSVAECLESALGGSVSEQTVGHGEKALPTGTNGRPRHRGGGPRHGHRHRAPTHLDQFALAEPEGVGPDWSADIRTRLRRRPSRPVHRDAGVRRAVTLYADDRPVVSGFREASPMVTGPEYPLHAVLDLDDDQEVELRVAYATSVAISVPGLPVQPHVRLGVEGPDDELERAVALAAASDIAVVLAGRISGEAMDVDSLRLPGRQQEVVAAVATANPRTILVTLSANPVILPETDLAAELHAWFPGEQFAEALADVLTGAAEPGGRLPITFPADEERTPMETASQYPGVDGVATYSEELLVGYRWYDERGVDPAFPFGHGMGYTPFEIDGLEVETAANGYRVRVTLRITGSRAGKAVLQIYVRYPPDAGEPGAQLKGFDAIRLEAGERRVVTIDITSDDLMIFDEESGSRILAEGEYEVRAGFSSRDIRATAVLQLRQKSGR